MWPFGKKKQDQPEASAEPSAVSEVTEDTVAGTDSVAQSNSANDDAANVAATNIVGGPFDAAEADPDTFDFSDFAKASVNLGSILLPVPQEADIQVEMGPQGPTMLHLATQYGRLTPVAFAAPTSGGQWQASVSDISDGLESDGLTVSVESGPWGEEIVATGNDMAMRIIGAEGPRWMFRITASGPAEHSEKLSELARGVVERVFVARGEQPMPAGQPLPVTLPSAMAEQIRQAYAQHQQNQGNGSAQA